MHTNDLISFKRLARSFSKSVLANVSFSKSRCAVANNPGNVPSSSRHDFRCSLNNDVIFLKYLLIRLNLDEVIYVRRTFNWVSAA